MPASFESLLTINEPHLIERYNRALASFDLQGVKLKEFQIDMIGYSPEVAKAMGDEDYLDPNKVNRRFIIVSPDQAHLPVVHSSFSNTRDLMAEFFNINGRVLNVLTIKDVVFGEIEDNVFEVDDIDDLLAIEQVNFKIGTHENLTVKTNQLKRMIDRLRKEPDAWHDDDMIHEMVAIAKQTGDIRDNELVPEEVVFRHETFWTSHFGGTYIFNDENQITVITDPSAPGFRKSRPWEVSYLDIKDKQSVYKFLDNTGRLQKPDAEWLVSSELLEQRKRMSAVYLASQNKDKLPTSLADKAWLTRWERSHQDLIHEDNSLPLLDWIAERVHHDLDIDMDKIDPEDKLLVCRANPEHEDMALVNRLISSFLPFDFISRFEFHRPKFVQAREKWPKAYAEFVANVIENTYLDDRDRLYENLYL